MTHARADAALRESAHARAAIDATGFEGAILVYDLKNDTYVAGHAERVDRRLFPASTFKVFNSLVAVETGVVPDADFVIEWDGVVRERKSLNEDLDLRTAFRISALPHYRELARRIGRERMQHFIDAAGYGNRDLSGEIDAFWLEGPLRISPREQVAFLTALYRGELPFSERTMDLVKGIMVHERTDDFTIRAKTGWARTDDGRNTGWWIGWVEKGDEVWVFATVLEATNPDSKEFDPAREAVTREVLGRLGALGKGPEPR